MKRVTIGWLLITAAAAVAYFVLPTTPLSKLLLYNGIALSAVIATMVGIRRKRPENRRAWMLILAGMISFLAGDICYYILDAVSETTPFPSPADALYLCMYPLVICGLLRLIRQISPGRDWPSLLDASIAAVGTFAVLGVLVIDTYVADGSMQFAGRLISVCYPVMDVALVAVAVRLVGVVPLRRPAYALLAAGLCSLLVADTIYGVLNSAGTFQTGGVADLCWLGFYVLVGTAALQPAMPRSEEMRSSSSSQLSRTRLSMLCLITLAVPTIDLVWGKPADKTLTAITSMVMFVLVLGRLGGLMGVVLRSEQRARLDTLTGLANRLLFDEHVARSVARGGEGVISVLFVDLDDFKVVNDSIGHQAGDDLLIAVAGRLRSCVRDGDLVARLSGDEFAVLLESAVDEKEAIRVVRRLQEQMRMPVVVGGREVLISASVGLVVEARSTVDRPQALLQAADVAMYRAKSKGKGRFEIFDHEMYKEQLDLLDLKGDLAVALERGQFEVFYQPIVDMGDERIVSIESLIRWHHPTRGLVTPDRFISLAEQTGLIVAIGRWVLREACQQLSRWQRQLPETAPHSVSVNLSARQLHDPDLVKDVMDALRESGLNAWQLTLELTESMMIDEFERASRILEQLRANGVQIAIDDFGTGFSSLSYLRRLPVDIIKIDRSFVMEMRNSATAEALVRLVIDLARVLELRTVAEGVEDGEQAEHLSSLLCDEGQGYFFARPQPAAAIKALLTPRQKSPAVDHRSLPQLDVAVVEGDHSLADLTADLGALHAEFGVPVNARMRWLQVWSSLETSWTPWAVLVREQESGRLSAAALLARREADGVHEVVAMGHGPFGTTRFAARDEPSARVLARAVADQIAALPDPWTLTLDNLSEGDLVGQVLMELLPNATATPVSSVPFVDLAALRNGADPYTHNMRRQLRKAENRLATDGLRADVQFARTDPEIGLLLPQLERIHVDRDHAAGRASDLDDTNILQLWRRLILAHTVGEQIEIATLGIEDSIVAYVVGLRDGTTYRVFDGHFDTVWARYSPGRLIECAVLQHLIADEQYDTVDWMIGVAAEKILVATGARGGLMLRAASQLPARHDAPALAGVFAEP
ncbi:MAG TPA: GNAT family N-acetyltransferase [Ilumatobacteraceae bacterium]|nr:GNAT family N-acetyltransferase [Ilumatobacteraceae bacterium]